MAKRLVSEGGQVIGVDNLATGRKDRLAELAPNPHFSYLDLDVTDAGIVNHPALQDVREIYHLASAASPRFYQADPFGTIAVNTTGTHNMLKLALKTGAKLLFSSTSEAYGDPLVHPQREDYRGNVNTWGPRACYDEAKRLGEVYCYEYWRRHALRVKVARIFNTYSAGLRTDDGRVISNFVTQALEERNITVYGDGSQTRSFCYVTDTVSGLRLMMEKDEANGEIINIGNDREYTILQTAELVKRLTGSSSAITFHPLPADDPVRRRPSIEKAARLLGWKPSVSLEEGLRRTIEAYRNGTPPE
ncbi:NAD-dependent epimerase/dehydratase family protein [Cohnella caldifontis]|uniref:NAD-dependent epimerase/dehydratase family protein n=1 Tax=Cohnella caldifontis TaxID=3027471 RepID=UPI003BB7BF8B